MTSKMTKAQEIELLRMFKTQIIEQAGDGAYLMSLLTDEFVIWVVNKIQEDIAPDIHNWLREFTTTNTSLQAQIRQMQADHEAQANALELNRAAMCDEVARLTEVIATQAADQGAQICELHNELSISEQDASHALRQVRELERHVLELKGELYMYQRRELEMYRDLADNETHQAVIERMHGG